ncbi:MAG TPA: PHB depolymerase family esterase [Polyangiaceae bacterium]|nr:PHB depolymerase family esterase [Polyangiaceae bacterium]
MWPRRRWAVVLGVLGLGCDRAAPEPAPEPGVGAAASAVAARAAPGATRRAQAPPAASAAASAAPHIKSVVSPPDGAASAGRSGGTRPPPLELPPSQRHEPTGLAPGQRRPLLVFLHGLGSSGRFAFEGLGLGELGRRERVFIVAPDGSTDANGRKFWNAHPACCDFDRRGPDDVARLGALIDAWRQRVDVDPARVYVAGFSNGGFMAHRLGCELPDRIAAIASIAGAGPAEGARCKTPSRVAVLEVHGDADAIVRFEGGHLFGRSGGPPHASAIETIARWGKLLGCDGALTPGDPFDLDARIAGDETQPLSYPRCAGPSPVLWRVRGGDHYIGRGAAYRDRIWAFLARQRLGVGNGMDEREDQGGSRRGRASRP